MLGVIGIRDKLRPDAAETVRMLHRQGISTVMLTGDDARTARAIAAEAGIDEVRADQLPADKAEAITGLVGAGRRRWSVTASTMPRRWRARPWASRSGRQAPLLPWSRPILPPPARICV